MHPGQYKSLALSLILRFFDVCIFQKGISLSQRFKMGKKNNEKKGEKGGEGNKRRNPQVLQIPSRKLRVGDNFNFAVALLADLYRIAQIPGAVIDFDLVVQELFERGDVEDLVCRRLGRVDDVLPPIRLAVTFRPFHP